MRMGPWSIARVLWQQIEYYYDCVASQSTAAASYTGMYVELAHPCQKYILLCANGRMWALTSWHVHSYVALVSNSVLLYAFMAEYDTPCM